MKQDYAKKIIHQLAEDYDTISDQFDQTRQHNWQEISDIIVNYVSKDSNILDIGCGNGRLVQNIPSESKYTGLDISPKLISKAKAKHPTHNFVTGDILALPFQDNSFDIVFAIASFHHIPSVEFRIKTINEITRVLNKDGIFVMTNWNLYQPKYEKYINTDYQISKDLDTNDTLIPWKNSDRDVLAQRYYHAFTLDEIEELFSEYEIIENKKSKHNLITIVKNKK